MYNVFVVQGHFPLECFGANSLYIRKPCTIFFYEKVVKWCNDINLSKSMGGGREFFDLLESKIQTPKIVRRMHFNNVNKERHYEYGGQYDSSELVF